MNEKIKELSEAISELDNIKRLHELERYIDNDNNVKSMIDNILELQQQMINCKHLNLINAYAEYKKQYEILKEKILLLPFMEEYLELLDEGHMMLKNICKIIEFEIEKDIK